MNCNTCSSYRNGRGSKACTTCDKFKDILPPSKPGPQIVNMRAEIIEDMSGIIPKEIIDTIRPQDLTQATMLLQSVILKATHEEIAEYHQVSKKTVQRRINDAIETTKELMEIS